MSPVQDYKIVQYMLDIVHPTSQPANLYLCEAEDGSKITVIIFEKRTDGSPYRITIEETK